MQTTIEVKVKLNGMLKAGKVPPTAIEMANSVKNTLIEYYTKLGGHYAIWGRDIQTQVQEGLIAVSINNPILHHQITGGTIRAKKSKFLTIPLTPEAQMSSARSFPKALVFIKSKAGNFLLVEIDQGKIVPQYVLKTQVYQPPVPRANPINAFQNVEQNAVKSAEQKIEQNEKQGI